MARKASARRLRAVVLAGASFFLGTLGHLQAEGHSLTASAFVVSIAFCILSGLAYSRRQFSGPTVAMVLLGNQIVLHLGLTLTTGPHAGHDTTGLIPSTWMLLAHLTATILTAIAIVITEGSYTACLAVLAWFSRLLRLSPGAVTIRRCSLCAAAHRHPSWSSRNPGSVPGRGPPAFVLA